MGLSKIEECFCHEIFGLKERTNRFKRQDWKHSCMNKLEINQDYIHQKAEWEVIGTFMRSSTFSTLWNYFVIGKNIPVHILSG